MEIKGIKYISPLLDGCYDAETELLTDNGWKFFKDLEFSDKVCTLSNDHIIEYHYPDRIIEKDWDGEMYELFGHRNCIDLLVTPDHSMYVQKEHNHKRKGKNVGWELEPAEKGFGFCRYFKKDGRWDVKSREFINICGRKIVTDDWLEFLGYYLSEGSSTITKRCDYIVQIRQTGEHLNKMASSLERVTNNKINIREADRVIVNDKNLALYLKSEFGNKYEKHIPREILNTCSSEQLTILFEALMLGDGHDNRKNSGGSAYYTSSKKLRDTFMELLLKIGYSGSYIKAYSKGDDVKVFDRIHKAKEDHWVIRIKFKHNCCSKKPYADSETKERFVNYKGKVYCATVPNHVMYVRRNGCPLWCGNSGYGEASRGYVLALHKMGVPITASPISFEEIRPVNEKYGGTLASLINKPIDYNIVITHATPHHFGPHKEVGKTNIGYTVWETTKLPPDWVEMMNKTDKILTSCSWNADVYKESGVNVPVGVVPHGIEMAEFDGIKPYNIKAINDDTFVFYDIFQFMERKNPTSLVRAYWHAFQNNENVALVLKTYRTNHSEKDKAMIRETMKRLKKVTPMPNPHAKVYMILDLLSRNEILGLHTRGNCFASLDRGEGFGLNGFTAGACGTPIIITGFGGALEYAKPDNSYLVNYTLQPVFGMLWGPWYTGDQLWAASDIHQASQLMKKVYENKEEAKQKGANLKKYIAENFTWERVAQKMVKEIEIL